MLNRLISPHTHSLFVRQHAHYGGKNKTAHWGRSLALAGISAGCFWSLLLSPCHHLALHGTEPCSYLLAFLALHSTEQSSYTASIKRVIAVTCQQTSTFNSHLSPPVTQRYRNIVTTALFSLARKHMLAYKSKDGAGYTSRKTQRWLEDDWREEINRAGLCWGVGPEHKRYITGYRPGSRDRWKMDKYPGMETQDSWQMWHEER